MAWRFDGYDLRQFDPLPCFLACSKLHQQFVAEIVLNHIFFVILLYNFGTFLNTKIGSLHIFSPADAKDAVDHNMLIVNLINPQTVRVQEMYRH